MNHKHRKVLHALFSHPMTRNGECLRLAEGDSSRARGVHAVGALAQTFDDFMEEMMTAQEAGDYCPCPGTQDGHAGFYISPDGMVQYFSEKDFNWCKLCRSDCRGLSPSPGRR